MPDIQNTERFFVGRRFRVYQFRVVARGTVFRRIGTKRCLHQSLVLPDIGDCLCEAGHPHRVTEVIARIFYDRTDNSMLYVYQHLGHEVV